MASNPFKVDWTDLEATKKYARELSSEGPRQLVLKYPGRDNYNIGFAEYEERYVRQGYQIIYRT